MTPLTLTGWCAAVLAVPLVACHAPTSPDFIVNPSPDEIQAHRAVWTSHNLMDYSYTHEFHAFNAVADQPILLVVRQNTVRAAVLVATGRSLEPTTLPTIDKLFDLALARATDHSLHVIVFDGALGYPIQMRFEAPPDALSSLQAGALHPL